MPRTSNRLWWTLWAAGTAVLASYFAVVLFGTGDKTVFMPGPLTDGHHQIGVACKSCHRDPYGGRAALQETCIECHGHARDLKALNSHPKSKFTDPRNFDRVRRLDATLCVTCHVEHRPEITRANGVTAPRDFCFYCHDDIAKERPSHRDLPFDGCYSAGCHNFHNNQALYEDFLLKHLHEPKLSETKAVPERELRSTIEYTPGYPLDRYPLQPLTAEDQDAPEALAIDVKIPAQWLSTAHARSGVNCSACHLRKAAQADRPIWENSPDHKACKGCHGPEVEGFLRGKHGLRLKVGLSPMRPAMARLPMQPKARAMELSCTSCHAAHAFDTRRAAAEACLACHRDDHSLAYKGSPHGQLWKKETTGALPPSQGVNCATCHMPRIDHEVDEFTSRIAVQHNQNEGLRPNEKMLRPACLHCHGLGFSIDALADGALITRNFDGAPSVHIESLEMAERKQRQDRERRRSEAAH